MEKKEVPYWLSQGDIFLNTTFIDNTPISLIEAMACGLCVVSTNVGGIPFLLDNCVDGILVPENDQNAMTNAILKILAEPDFASNLSMNAREKAEKFDWAVVLPQWESIYLELINQNE
jgi:glycosyltransferase involved in cell wall biosynthesis